MEKQAVPAGNVRIVVGVVAFIAVLLAVASRVYEVFVAQPAELAIVRTAALDVTPAHVVAPPIDLATLDGKRFRLADHQGQVIFINFWATWCPPCREEMPSMMALGRELEARYPGKFKMVAVSVDDGPNPVSEFLSAPPFGGLSQVGVTVALDPDQKVTQAYYCAARGKCPDDVKFPESYVVDQHGKLVSYIVGGRDWSLPAARSFLEGLLRSP